ncbi:phosphoribosylglycinamide synthetase [Micromonospora sp. R77]|uniref:ATP-binding protein n=1 Tax=Micromonospora sp. R77 TaxID=2925836 RepID=UPI001F6231C5|nr:phosphoribosylglycinamide synthetase [Micromonospora sp. R77]MCI4061250.1 phosphoribosylglycinamide synthetase [Micromonospora sp. R77]
MRTAIVDACGIGVFLPAALARYDVDVVHVRSGTPDVHLPYPPGNFTHEIAHEGDLAATAERLRALGVEFVVPGTESGVLLAEALSAELGTPGNGMSRPRARRDKYEMVEAVREAGLPVARSIATGSVDELVDWAQDLGEWPVVVKPRSSAGTDNVAVCRTAGELREAAGRVLGSTDRYGARNDTLLGQQFLHGDEYFVNTVSRGGVHHVVEVWRYHKRQLDSGALMYDHEEPVPPDDPVVGPLVAYTLAVLDALEVRNSAAHTEVMLTKEGPVLVESAGRAGGSHVPAIVSRCLGTDQIDCLARAIARPEDLISGALPPYRLLNRLRYVTLINPRPGVAPAGERLDRIRSLDSFLELVLTAPEGAPIGPTVDLATSPGYLYLSSPDVGQVEADYQRLRRWEEADLYATGS